jgi:hypothetical protein
MMKYRIGSQTAELTKKQVSDALERYIPRDYGTPSRLLL